MRSGPRAGRRHGRGRVYGRVGLKPRECLWAIRLFQPALLKTGANLGAVHLRKGRQELAVLAQAFQLTLRDGSRLMASDFATEQALLRSEIATKDPRATGSQLCTRLFHKPTGLRGDVVPGAADGRALPARDP